jgi:hypothetical protein
METDKHIDIIRSRLDRLLRELRATPVLSQAKITAALKSVVLEVANTVETGGRSMTLTELRERLTDMPGARPVLEAIDAAIADGAD